MKKMTYDKFKCVLKTAVVLLTCMVLIASLVGCSVNPYAMYQQANEKTEAAKTGVYDLELNLTNTFDTSGMTEDQLKAVNYMKQVSYKGKSTIDESQQAIVSDSWLNLGGIGFDFTYYGKGDQQYIKYPVLKKYIDLKAMMASAQRPEQGGQSSQMPTLSLATQEQLGQIWDRLASKDSVKSVEDVIIPTDSGDMKAKHLTLEVSGEAVKSALLASQELILKDPEIKAAITKQMAKTGAAAGEPVTLMTEGMTLGDFEISSYVSADGYLVKTEVKITISGLDKTMKLKESTFHMTTVYSSLDQPVTLDFPVITPDQVFQPEELNKEMPSVFKELME